ncbi:MAG TPA: succinylglutamate desuccinylase/aspartoacylase family protein [Candidatus Polarisedimenticolia bacterium]|nr:succinylglutamate desuccinylase/aspartoacylase family protein [Candidatus Polarisedimenticolia bacterium]
MKKRRAQARSFAIGGKTIQPGAMDRVVIPIAPLYTQQRMDLAAFVLHGNRPGCRLWVSAGIHGDEILGMDVIRRLLRKVDAAKLAGTLVAVPFVNAFGLVQQIRYLPDRRDLNRTFPGSKHGSLAARLAHAFMNEIVARCTHGIDLHTAAIHRDNLPQIRANLNHPATRRMAEAFGAPVMIHANLRDGSLREEATSRGIPTLLYEAGEALRYDARVVRAGLDGVLGVMKSLGMIEEAPPARETLVARRTSWVRAPKSGFLIHRVDLGERVKRGERLGAIHTRIHHPLLRKTRTIVRAHQSGLIIGISRNPLVYVGDPVVHIATVGSA